MHGPRFFGDPASQMGNFLLSSLQRHPAKDSSRNGNFNSYIKMFRGVGIQPDCFVKFYLEIQFTNITSARDQFLGSKYKYGSRFALYITR